MNSEYIPFIVIPLIMMCFDVLSGVIKAIKQKELSSTKAREGLYHKMGFVILLLFSLFLTYSQSYINLGIDIPILQATAIYICCTELISTLENLRQISPELCTFLDKFIQDKKEDVENEEK